MLTSIQFVLCRKLIITHLKRKYNSFVFYMYFWLPKSTKRHTRVTLVYPLCSGSHMLNSHKTTVLWVIRKLAPTYNSGKLPRNTHLGKARCRIFDAEGYPLKCNGKQNTIPLCFSPQNILVWFIKLTRSGVPSLRWHECSLVRPVLIS